MARKNSNIKLRELVGAKDFAALFPLIKQANPSITKKEFNQSLKVMLANNYRCIGAYQGKKLLGICGMWSGVRFWCGEYMEVDNLVVDQNQRSSGIGGLLMAWVEKEAKRRKCRIVMADSYTYNHASHRFYFREGYIIKGYSFVKEIL